MKKTDLTKHYTQQKKIVDRKSLIKSASDIREDKYEQHGNKIILEIPLDNIYSHNQVRKNFDENKLNNLAMNIKEIGLKQPITVMKVPNEKDRYTLKLGERRYLAHKLINKKSIRCIVEINNNNEAEIILDQFSENKQRVDLTPLECAESIIALKNMLKIKAEALGNKLGMSKTHIDRLNRIYKLPETHKSFIAEAKYGYREITEFMKLSEPDKNKVILGYKESINNQKVFSDSNKKQYETREGIKEYKNSYALRLKIHNDDQREEIKRKIKIAQGFIDRAKQHLNKPKPR